MSLSYFAEEKAEAQKDELTSPSHTDGWMDGWIDGRLGGLLTQ